MALRKLCFASIFFFLLTAFFYLPSSAQAKGNSYTYTYKVQNPGIVPLAELSVVDNQCPYLSGRLGDTNSNSLLDSSETWIYSCTTAQKRSVLARVTVTAYANGIKAEDYATVSVSLQSPSDISSPNLPDTGPIVDKKIQIWKSLFIVLVFLIALYFFTHRSKFKKHQVRKS